MLTDRIAYWASSILFLLAFIFHSGANSNVSWIAEAFQPYAFLVYIFVFVGGLIFVYAALTGRVANPALWALIFAGLGTLAYWIWTTGAILGWF